MVSDATALGRGVLTLGANATPITSQRPSLFRLDRNLSPPRGNNIKGLPTSNTEPGAVATALNERIS